MGPVRRSGGLIAMAKIDRCDVYLCVADLSEPRGPSSGWYDTRESVLVRPGTAIDLTEALVRAYATA